ncbi:MAG: zinc-dependent alcohol dehydrogenase family protein [Bacteroidota bacterium]
MKAIYFEKFQERPRVQHVGDPMCPGDGVIVKVEYTGLCRSDWHGWMGHDDDIVLPHVPGHELVGEVVEVGADVRRFKGGERVTVPFVAGCGHCEWCASGNHQICDHQFQPGFTAWGSFAEYVSLRYADTNVVELPGHVSSLAAVSLGCRFVTSFRAVVDQGKVQGGQWMAVHGCGGVGLSAVMIGAAMGAQVIAIDVNQENLQMAANFGSSKLIDSRQGDVVKQVMEYTSGGAHVSIDALGSRQTCVDSIASLRKRGKHIQVGLLAGEDHMPPIPMHWVIAKELELIGSHGMQAFRYPAVFEMIRSGRIAPEQMINRIVGWEVAASALEQMDDFQHQGITVLQPSHDSD